MLYTANEKSFVIVVAQKEGKRLKNVVYSNYESDKTSETIELADLKEFSLITDWEDKEIYVWSDFETMTPLCDTMK